MQRTRWKDAHRVEYVIERYGDQDVDGRFVVAHRASGVVVVRAAENRLLDAILVRPLQSELISSLASRT